MFKSIRIHTLAVLTALTLLGQSTFLPNKSQASIGAIATGAVLLATAPAVGTTAGLVLITAGGLGVFTIPETALYTLLGGWGMTTFFGIVILDQPAYNAAPFRPMTLQMAKNFKMTESELLSYNSDLDAINASFEQTGLDMSKQDNLTQSQAHQIWLNNISNLDPQTRSAIDKISATLLKN